jgi:uncharacterized coiled-coil protein SlyX
MKHIPFAAFLILMSCGKQTTNKLIENPYNDSDIKGRVTDLEAKVAGLEQARSNLFNSINSLEYRIADQSDASDNLATDLSAAESSLALVTSQLLVLRTNVNIVKIVDPCGDTPNKYDEVLFKTSDGQYVGSFSDNASGLNTRFSVLPIGSYVTTDDTGCYFQVTENGII